MSVANLENKQSNDLFWERLKIIDKGIMLNKLIQLNLSLYHAILDYAKRNGIPLPLDATLLRLADEIEKTDTETFPQKLSDGFSQPKPSAKDFTEPYLETKFRKLLRQSWNKLCFL
jgi:hypothetical protein